MYMCGNLGGKKISFIFIYLYQRNSRNSLNLSPEIFIFVLQNSSKLSQMFIKILYNSRTPFFVFFFRG